MKPQVLTSARSASSIVSASSKPADLQLAHEPLAVDEVLGAAEGDEGDRGRARTAGTEAVWDDIRPRVGGRRGLVKVCGAPILTQDCRGARPLLLGEEEGARAAGRHLAQDAVLDEQLDQGARLGVADAQPAAEEDRGRRARAPSRPRPPSGRSRRPGPLAPAPLRAGGASSAPRGPGGLPPGSRLLAPATAFVLGEALLLRRGRFAAFFRPGPSSPGRRLLLRRRPSSWLRRAPLLLRCGLLLRWRRGLLLRRPAFFLALAFGPGLRRGVPAPRPPRPGGGSGVGAAGSSKMPEPSSLAR